MTRYEIKLRRSMAVDGRPHAEGEVIGRVEIDGTIGNLVSLLVADHVEAVPVEPAEYKWPEKEPPKDDSFEEPPPEAESKTEAKSTPKGKSKANG